METIKSLIEALDELAVWNEKLDRFDPRLTRSDWLAALDAAEDDDEVAKRVSMLQRLPLSRVLLPPGSPAV